MYVTYAGNADTHFDRKHWINVHLPLVRECWGPYGLEHVGSTPAPAALYLKHHHYACYTLAQSSTAAEFAWHESATPPIHVAASVLEPYPCSWQPCHCHQRPPQGRPHGPGHEDEGYVFGQARRA